jgi:2-(1,2-epoxy-1,2-dihydrophenyl)acetyl-CoA isomerase
MAERGIDVSIEDGVGTITLSRPDRLNAFDLETIDALAAACSRLGYDDAVRAILVTGSGRGFCAGLDLKAATKAVSDTPLQELVRRIVTSLHGVVSELRRAPKPVVSAVNGIAAGAGVGIALAGDVVICARSAAFALSYAKIGLSPDGSTTYFVTRLIGEKRALDLFFSAEPLPAVEAERMGLVSRVVDDAALEREARALAKKLASGPTQSYAHAKALVLDAVREGLETQMEKERRAIALTFTSADFAEGVQAFLAKRKPVFAGR